MRDDRARLQTLLTALNASTRGLRRDDCDDHAIIGKDGHIYVDGDGFLLCVSTDESSRRWTFVKKRLASFCRVTQDGDIDGCLYLDHLPSPAEAELIREALGIRKRRELTDEAREHLARARTLLNRPFAAVDASNDEAGTARMTNRPQGFYSAYLRKLADDAERRTKPAPKEPADCPRRVRPQCPECDAHREKHRWGCSLDKAAA